MAINRTDWQAESTEKAGFPYEHAGTHLGI